MSAFSSKKSQENPGGFKHVLHSVLSDNSFSASGLFDLSEVSTQRLLGAANGPGTKTDLIRLRRITRLVVSFLDEQLMMRDQGICALCALDTHALFDALTWYAKWREQRCYPGMVSIAQLKAAIGRRAQRWPKKRLWDADHIVPVSRGGNPYSLENLRTLCLECHYIETRRLVYSAQQLTLEMPSSVKKLMASEPQALAFKGIAIDRRKA